MEYTFRIVQIYSDNVENLILLPTGRSEKLKGATKAIDLPCQLNKPYLNEDIERAALLVMSQCFSKSPDNEFDETVLEKLFNIKGYAKAVKGRKLITFEWRETEGYKVVPKDKIQKRGYIDKQNDIIYLGKDIKNGELAKAIEKAIAISTTY